MRKIIMANGEELKIHSKMLMSEKTKPGTRSNHNGDVLKRITFENEITKDRYFIQDNYSWPHSSPGSTTVIAVGNRWKKDENHNCELMIRDMCTYAQQKGYKIFFEEVAVWFGAFPNPAVAATREQGAYIAIENSTEYVFFVDNDILPTEDLLVNLLELEVPMVTPMIIDPYHGNMIGGPIREKNSGVYNQKWSSMSAILIKTSLLSLPGVRFGQDDTEGLFFQRFARWGHTVHIDTSQELRTITPPTRPDSMNYEEREQMNKDRYSHIFDPRIPIDQVATDLFNQQKATGNNQIKVM